MIILQEQPMTLFHFDQTVQIRNDAKILLDQMMLLFISIEKKVIIGYLVVFNDGDYII